MSDAVTDSMWAAMDVLHVIHQFPPESRGGSESYAFDVAQRQRARGLEVAVFTGTKHAASSCSRCQGAGIARSDA